MAEVLHVSSDFGLNIFRMAAPPLLAIAATGSIYKLHRHCDETYLSLFKPVEIKPVSMKPIGCTSYRHLTLSPTLWARFCRDKFSDRFKPDMLCLCTFHNG
jgi:hypothetical protein